MFAGINMNRLVGGSKAAAAGSKKTTGAGKRKAEVSPRKMDATQKKRSALGDLTNAVKKKGTVSTKDKVKLEKAIANEPPLKVMTRLRSKSLVNAGDSEISHEVGPSRVDENIDKAKQKEKDQKQKPVEKATLSKLPVRQTRSSRSRASEESTNTVVLETNESLQAVGRRMKTRSSSTNPCPSTLSSLQDSTETEDDDSSLYQTAVSSPDTELIFSQDVEEQNRKNEALSVKKNSKLPHGVVDFDAEAGNDPFQVGLYAEDIFAYYRRRETRFPIRKYLDKQSELNRNMRSILVDWMVEVQESFELNHETLYLGVKIVDLFLTKVQVKREKLQLVGTTALYISAKYDERCPPVIDDFCYICDDAYPQKDVIKMEAKILRALNFDIGVPLSYRFLRRYSRCAKLDMDTLTLARYISEMSLMEYDFIDVRESMVAAGALLLALMMKGVKNPWNATLEYYSGYSVHDLFDFTHRLHAFLAEVPSHLKTIRSKYSHKIFYEAAKVPLMEELKL